MDKTQKNESDRLNPGVCNGHLFSRDSDHKTPSKYARLHGDVPNDNFLLSSGSKRLADDLNFCQFANDDSMMLPEKFLKYSLGFDSRIKTPIKKEDADPEDEIFFTPPPKPKSLRKHLGIGLSNIEPGPDFSQEIFKLEFELSPLSPYRLDVEWKDNFLTALSKVKSKENRSVLPKNRDGPKPQRDPAEVLHKKSQYQKYKDRKKSYHREWQQKNKAKVWAYNKKYMAKKAGRQPSEDNRAQSVSSSQSNQNQKAKPVRAKSSLVKSKAAVAHNCKQAEHKPRYDYVRLFADFEKGKFDGVALFDKYLLP
jgi:hypothetical protein